MTQPHVSPANHTARDLIALSIAASVVFVAFQLLTPASFRTAQGTDFNIYYLPVAKNLLQGNFFIRRAQPAFEFPPGHTLIVAGVAGLTQLIATPEDFTFKLFTLVCVVLSVALIYLLANLFFERRVALVAALLWLTYPPYLSLTFTPLSELTFIPMLLASVYAFARYMTRANDGMHAALVAGVLAALAALIRPIAVALNLVYAVLMLALARERSWGSRAATIALMLIVNVALLAPWELYMYAQTNTWIPLATRTSAGVFDGLTYAVANPDMPADLRAAMEQASTRYRTGADDKTGNMLAFVFDEALRDPGLMLRFYGLKALRAWYATTMFTYEPYFALLQLPYLAFTLVGIGCVWRMGSQPRRFLWLALAVISYFWFMTVATLSILRYMVPVMGLTHILAAVGLMFIAQRVFNRQRT